MKLKISKLMRSLTSLWKSSAKAKSHKSSKRSTHKVLVSPSVKNEEYYIISQPQLDEVVKKISERKVVALDTEFTRRNTYYPILSIIQIAVKNSSGKLESFIVDCLADIDLSELFALIADEKIIKILHSPSQDLQIFHHQSGLTPRGILDTQILASFCGIGFNVGYSALVEALFQKQLNKAQQNSNWQRRPLSSGQIKYALLDVFYLEEIYEKLMADLSKTNRLSWYLEEMESFTAKSITQSEENLMKKISLRRKNSQQIAQIENLVSWRERWARELDVPRQHLLSDEEIEMLVSEKISSDELGKNVTKAMAKEIKKILQSQSESQRKKSTLISEHQKRLIHKAKTVVAQKAAQENLREQFLLTNSDVRKIVCDQANLKEMVTDWRYQLFGEELNNLINS